MPDGLGRARGPASACCLPASSPTAVLRLPALLLLAALAAPASGQPGRAVAADRDVRIDGESVVGRWVAVEVENDARATADLARGTLTTVLVVNPTGHVILRGADTREGRGAPAAFSGLVSDGRLRFNGLDGEALLERHGRTLHLVDPRGRRTVFVRRDQR